MKSRLLLLLLSALLLAEPASAELFKCRDAKGRYVYSDLPCAGVEVPLQEQGSVSTVKIPPRQFVPAYQDNSPGGAVSSMDDAPAPAGGGSVSSPSLESDNSRGPSNKNSVRPVRTIPKN
ncbi:DUF4124 domain-containing protein [Chitinibacter sp. S2-10]|uniref:DUF4124 domain-containing protein n=1 Tax=Chitinibacter sp. S2-10 TaxID=3373597 RepID=UPI003977A3FB